MALKAKPYLQRIELDYASVESLEKYPFHIPAIRELYGLKFHPDVHRDALAPAGLSWLAVA